MQSLESYTFIPDGISCASAFKRTTHLAIGAHQDDLEIFAYHGISACFEQEERWFGGVTVTDGGGSARTGLYAEYSDEEMKRVRYDEQNEAAKIGKYSFQTQLKVPSSVVKNSNEAGSLVEQLTVLLKACRPQTLYLHNPVDKHATHLGVLTQCIAALRKLDADEIPEQIYGCEVWRDLDWLRDEDKIALPVDSHPELARELIKVFESQVSGGKDYVTATLGRRHANATYFSSHSVDGCSAITFAMDLRPLLEDSTLSLPVLAEQHILQFRSDVASAYSQLLK